MNNAALNEITYGLFVVSSFNQQKLNGYVGNTVIQVSSNPLKIAIACSKNNYTAELIKEREVFSVSILHNQVKKSIISQFGYQSGRDTDKFLGVSFKFGSTGCPILLEDANAWIECQLIDTFDVGSHYLFIGSIVDCDVIDNKEPLTYAYYHKVFKGKSPKNAPTFNTEESTNNHSLTNHEKNMEIKKYQCEVCGYVYDPAIGDPDSGIAIGTKFEDIPDDWVCPVCGVDKSNFKLME